MKTWREVWRQGVLPGLTERQLQTLRAALESDDPRLLQGATTTPPPLQCVQDWPAEAVCLLGFCAVDDLGGFGEATVGDVGEAFSRLCCDVDIRLDEPAGVRWLLNWYDETPRAEMRRELLAEIDRALMTLC
jgi:hypothetical protein